MAKAQFHKHQKVWVESVGAWAVVEKLTGRDFAEFKCAAFRGERRFKRRDVIGGKAF